MATTYQLISSVTVGSGGAANISFTSIPATYTDLKLVLSQRYTSGGNVVDVVDVTFNSTSPATGRVLTGNGASAGSITSTRLGVGNGSASTASTFNNLELYVPNYTSSNYKSFSADSVTENNASDAGANLVAGIWQNTAVITSITLSGSANMAQYSTAYLYGISNA